MGIFANICRGLRESGGMARSQWEPIVPEIRKELHCARLDWFKVVLSHFNQQSPPPVVQALDGAGEFCAYCYQAVLTNYFLVANKYVVKHDIPAFITALESPLILEHGAEDVLQFSKRYCRDGAEQVTDYVAFARDMAMYTFGVNGDRETSALLEGVPGLTMATYLVISSEFRDKATFQKLQRFFPTMESRLEHGILDPRDVELWHKTRERLA